MWLPETPCEETIERPGCLGLSLCWLCVYKYTYIHTYISMKICTQSHWLSANNTVHRGLVSAVSRKDKSFPLLLEVRLDIKLL